MSNVSAFQLAQKENNKRDKITALAFDLKPFEGLD